MRSDRFAPLPPDAAATLYDGLKAEDDWRLVLPYVPDDKRGGALTILALMRELEGVPARVSEPMLGRIRCQWWRDALDEAFGPGRVRAHPLGRAIEATLGNVPEMSPPLHALVDGAEDVLDRNAITDTGGATTAARRLWGRAAAALCGWLGAPGAADAAAEAGAAHAVLRLAGHEAQAVSTRSLPRASDMIAGTTIPKDEAERLATDARARTKDLPDAALPAVLPATLLHAYADARPPSPVGKRVRYLRAMLRGRP